MAKQYKYQVPSLLDKLEQDRISAGVSSHSRESRDWVVSKAREIKNSGFSRNSLMADEDRLVNRLGIGKLYFYFYDPKWKIILPYYDNFPLTIPIDYYKDGFLGLNLHYLSPLMRAKLLDKLQDFASNKRYNENTRLELSYNLLNGAKRYREFRPCVKRYLYPHVRSRFLRVDAPDWEKAIFLPVADFVGASERKVWSESLKKII